MTCGEPQTSQRVLLFYRSEDPWGGRSSAECQGQGAIAQYLLGTNAGRSRQVQGLACAPICYQRHARDLWEDGRVHAHSVAHVCVSVTVPACQLVCAARALRFRLSCSGPGLFFF